jgi:hypothetical protein
MAKLTKEICPDWPEILATAPDTIGDEWHEIDIEEAGAVREATSRRLKKSNPEMKFKTKIIERPDGTKYLGLRKTTKSS